MTSSNFEDLLERAVKFENLYLQQLEQEKRKKQSFESLKNKFYIASARVEELERVNSNLHTREQQLLLETQDLRREREEFSCDLDKQIKLREAQERESNSLLRQKDSLIQRLSFHQSEEGVIKELKGQIQELQEALIKQKKKNDSLTSQLEEAQTRFCEDFEAVQETNDRIVQLLTNDIKKLTEELDLQSSIRSELDTCYLDLSKLRNELASVRSQKQIMEKQWDEKNATNISLLSQTSGELQDLRHRYQDALLQSEEMKMKMEEWMRKSHQMEYELKMGNERRNDLEEERKMGLVKREKERDERVEGLLKENSRLQKSFTNLQMTNDMQVKALLSEKKMQEEQWERLLDEARKDKDRSVSVLEKKIAMKDENADRVLEIKDEEIKTLVAIRHELHEQCMVQKEKLETMENLLALRDKSIMEMEKRVDVLEKRNQELVEANTSLVVRSAQASSSVGEKEKLNAELTAQINALRVSLNDQKESNRMTMLEFNALHKNMDAERMVFLAERNEDLKFFTEEKNLLSKENVALSLDLEKKKNDYDLLFGKYNLLQTDFERKAAAYKKTNAALQSQINSLQQWNQQQAHANSAPLTAIPPINSSIDISDFDILQYENTLYQHSHLLHSPIS